ncbi:MAG: hypothetical protein NC115_05890 [Bacteroidales bacterium]|nr:hypothetical protein [Bacteroidales bacterium]
MANFTCKEKTYKKRKSIKKEKNNYKKKKNLHLAAFRCGAGVEVIATFGSGQRWRQGFMDFGSCPS